ncbi:MAG: zinc-ribbon domain-containing protein [Deltaproteobacteria bacterium]|nr:zinc-ribbon domain-containing protein [Deltaproteobacteria bacterium]
MIITCEECQASFNLDESLLKPTGSKVRCSKCKKVFVAYPPELPCSLSAGTSWRARKRRSRGG